MSDKENHNTEPSKPLLSKHIIKISLWPVITLVLCYNNMALQTGKAALSC